jgi:hypothetical protein
MTVDSVIFFCLKNPAQLSCNANPLLHFPSHVTRRPADTTGNVTNSLFAKTKIVLSASCATRRQAAVLQHGFSRPVWVISKGVNNV